MKKKDFIKIITIVIRNFEGGYFHPKMMGELSIFKKMKVSDPKLYAEYSNSGETMFGLDRKAGIGLKKLNPQAWNAFWRVIDFNKKNWKYNYMGGSVAGTLSQLLASIMYVEFLDRWNKYLPKKTQEVITKDCRLVLHFAYATWHAPGFFKVYANRMALRTEKKFDYEQLAKLAVADRKTSKYSSIRKTGINLERLFATMKNCAADSPGSGDKKKKVLKIGIFTTIGLALTYAGYYFYKKEINDKSISKH